MPGSAAAYNRTPRGVVASREEVGGGHSSDDGRDNITRSERRAPASSMCVLGGGASVSASASSTDRVVVEDDDRDTVRALQRTLYRSAKQDRTRRFHSLSGLGDHRRRGGRRRQGWRCREGPEDPGKHSSPCARSRDPGSASPARRRFDLRTQQSLFMQFPGPVIQGTDPQLGSRPGDQRRRR